MNSDRPATAVSALTAGRADPEPGERLTLDLEPRTALDLWPAVGPQAAVLVIPALGTPARLYAPLAQALARRGCSVGVVELRGVGQSPIRARRGVDWGYADLIDGECHAALRMLAARHPGRPLWALGHSLGGQLAVLYAARRHRPELSGIVLAASGTPYWRAYPLLSSGLVLALGALARASVALCGYFPGQRFRFGGRQPARLMREWATLLASGRFRVEGWTDDLWRARLGTLELPVLPLAIGGDHLVPPGAIAHLARSAGCDARVETHGSGGHFAWLRTPEPIAARVAAFITDPGSRR